MQCSLDTQQGVRAFLMSQNRGFFLTSTYKTKSKCGQNLTNNVLSITLFSSHC